MVRFIIKNVNSSESRGATGLEKSMIEQKIEFYKHINWIDA